MKNIDIKNVFSSIIDKFQQKPVLLWENPNPTSNFGEQSINSTKPGWVGPSSLSNFNIIRIIYNEGIIIEQKVGCTITISTFASLDASSKTAQRFRLVTTSANGLSFSRGCYKIIDATAYSYDDSNIVPNKIYGIK